MKWLLIAGGALLLLSQRQARASAVQTSAPAPSTGRGGMPAVQGTPDPGVVVDRVKNNVTDIIDSVQQFWDAVSGQSISTPTTSLPAGKAPITTNTAAFS